MMDSDAFEKELDSHYHSFREHCAERANQFATQNIDEVLFSLFKPSLVVASVITMFFVIIQIFSDSYAPIGLYIGWFFLFISGLDFTLRKHIKSSNFTAFILVGITFAFLFLYLSDPRLFSLSIQLVTGSVIFFLIGILIFLIGIYIGKRKMRFYHQIYEHLYNAQLEKELKNYHPIFDIPPQEMEP